MKTQIRPRLLQETGDRLKAHCAKTGAEIATLASIAIDKYLDELESRSKKEQPISSLGQSQ